ncbi:MAG: AAA family ATPase, partial [Salinibacterium sp.]|nr:AAA family ATPase [Salinibacterium sp.]
LALVVIADDLQAARAAYSKAPEELTFVTRDGDVLTRFVLRGGSGAKRSRLELVAERDTAATRLTAVTTQIERTRFAIAEQRGALESAKASVTTALSAVREHDANLAAQSEQLGKLRIRLDAAEAECSRLADGVEIATDQVREAETAHDAAIGAHQEFEAQPRPMLDASARAALLAEVDANRATELELRIQLETVRERVRAERARADSLAAQMLADREAAEEQARLTVIRARQVAAASAVVASLPAVLNSVDRSLSQARVELAAREAERSQQNDELSALRREELGLRERLAAVSDTVHGLEMQIYEKKLHLSTLLERAGEELGLVEDVLLAEYGPDVPIPGATVDSEPQLFDRAEQRARLADAERKLAQLGRVNPLALEEFAALEQRHKFLTNQLTDLTNTRKDLLTIIDEIDDKMQDIFGSAFEDTKAAFHEVFPILFPGGTGSIHLTDPDNMLTTGIEVTVKPAGKKIERLSLLSGGERSLAAVALLIAIFKARPSPFYIMDEVEAALDDANLGRLLTIFEDLRQTSQLIIITHQKRTMEIADALYGVSMRSDGISAVVGQRVGDRATDSKAS